jgi:hypothetical protein
MEAETDGKEEPAGEYGKLEEQVEPQVDEATVAQLVDEMGFPRNRAVRAIYSTGSTSVEQLVEWLEQHAEDEDIDEPLRVSRAEATKKARTKEEIKEILERKKREAREKKAELEKQQEIEQEKERIRSGKEIAQAKRAEEEQRLKRLEEQREVERKEEHRARNKVKEKLKEDWRARRRAQGLPDELTEEEKEREAEKERERQRQMKAEEEKRAKAGIVLKPADLANKLRQPLVHIKKSQPSETSAECFKTLKKLVSNVWNDPDNEKFRKLRLSNSAIQNKVVQHGGLDFLKLCNFKQSGDDRSGELSMERNEVDINCLWTAISELNDAMDNPYFGLL